MRLEGHCRLEYLVLTICYPQFPRRLLEAASWAALGICYNSGQDCTAGSRVYVQDRIYDKFLELLIAKVKALKFGDGFDDTVASGPLVTTCHYFPLVFLSGSQVSKVQYDRVRSYIQAGIAEGATLVLGGEERLGKGYLLSPTSTSRVPHYQGGSTKNRITLQYSPTSNPV